jgi:hypothetical protein
MNFKVQRRGSLRRPGLKAGNRTAQIPHVVTDSSTGNLESLPVKRIEKAKIQKIDVFSKDSYIHSLFDIY